MRYTKEIYEQLLEVNTYLQNDPEDKYNDFAEFDPFPDIPDSLLNSEDIIKYVLTTGMIEPFNIEKLAGALYTCDFSGEYYFWNQDKVQKCNILGDDDELTLLPNSITYLAVKEFFRIPLYIALRFNLRVRDVYKGLLLGTGPIVDPNFIGQLFIPLHNLTSNHYIIKKGAKLIDVEFTKLSRNNSWRMSKELEDIIKTLCFKKIPYVPKQIEQGRKFSEYITRALNDDPYFHKLKPDEICVNSSISEEIMKFEGKIKDYNEILAQKCREMDNKLIDFDKSLKKDQELSAERYKGMKSSENFVKAFISLSLIGVIVSIAGLIVAVSDLLHNSNEVLNSSRQQLQISTDINSSYENRMDILEDQLDSLSVKIGKLEDVIKSSSDQE